MIIVKKPKIRFKGFTETWEQRKFCDIANMRRGLTYKPTNIVNNGKRVLRSSNINKDHFEIHDDDVFVDESIVNIPYVENGDILVTSANGSSRLVGKHAILREIPVNSMVHGGFMLLISSEEPNFLNASMCSSWYIKFINVFVSGGNGSIGNLSKKDLEDQTIYVPNILEQRKIGDYFSKLDNLITLHQRKCENLKKLKKFMLQKLFPQNGENVPEIRFSGFTVTWEQRKLENYLQEYNEVTSTNNQYPALTSSRKGLFLQTDYFSGNQVASENNIGYNVVPYGYFTYRHMSDDEVFHFNINDIVDKGIVSTLYPVFTTSKELDSKYLQYQLNYGEEFSRFARLQKQGGSRTYMYLNKLRKLSLTMPNTLDEQKEISAILSTLDHLITLHQSECDNLKEVKKYMLQNMFI